MWGKLFDLNNPLIGEKNTWMLWAVCATCAALAIYLEQRYKWAAKLTGVILALALAIILSNTGVVPVKSAVYDTVWDYVVPLAIPLLLLGNKMHFDKKESGKFVLVFIIGAVGTAFGAVLAYAVLRHHIPELDKLAGVFTGTYIGGTVNFAALGATFHVSSNLMSAATVADNLLMVLFFFVLLALPSIRFFRKHFSHPFVDQVEKGAAAGDTKNNVAGYWKGKEISLKDIAISIAAGFVIVALSNNLADLLARIIPTSNTFLEIINALFGNNFLWITTLSMAANGVFRKTFGNLKGSQEIGTFLIYIFFFVIGIPASITLIIKNSPLLLLFAGIIVFINLLVSLMFGKLINCNLEEIILAVNANIGGPTTAAAMAVSKGWVTLVGPSILLGTLGYVLGTYFGLFVGSILGL